MCHGKTGKIFIRAPPALDTGTPLNTEKEFHVSFSIKRMVMLFFDVYKREKTFASHSTCPGKMDFIPATGLPSTSMLITH